MTKLSQYLDDGAWYQAKAVLAFLQPMQIEESYNKEWHDYEADIKVWRWENCREQWYVVYLKAKNLKQLNIAFFEHRNSDCIEAVKWEQWSMNSLHIDNAEFWEVYKTKWETSHSESYWNVSQMADWIFNELKEFWISNPKEQKQA